MLEYGLIISGAYVIGSIPVGYIIARWHGIEDIRRYGSGVIGATNVARVLGLKFFFLTFFLDAIKSFGYLSCCSYLSVPRFIIFLSSFALLLGNSYSCFLRGVGGKGVATLVGIMLVLNPWLCVAALGTWLISFYGVRVVGIASVIAALFLPFYAILLTDLYGFLFIIIMVSWVIWRHRLNIRLFYAVR